MDQISMNTTIHLFPTSQAAYFNPSLPSHSQLLKKKTTELQESKPLAFVQMTPSRFKTESILRNPNPNPNIVLAETQTPNPSPTNQLILPENHDDSRRSSLNPLKLSKLPKAKPDIDIFKIAEARAYKKLQRFSDSYFFQGLIIAFTVFSLFGADVKVLSCDSRYDIVWDIFFWLSFVLFLLEIFLSLVTRKNYTFSFFFWLDIFSTITILIDISSIDQNIL